MKDAYNGSVTRICLNPIGRLSINWLTKIESFQSFKRLDTIY